MNRFLFTVLFTTQRSRKFSKWSCCPRWRKEVWRNKGLSYIALKCSSSVLNPAFYMHTGRQRTKLSGFFPSIKKEFPVKIPLIHSTLACWEFSSIPLVTPFCSSLFCIIPSLSGIYLLIGHCSCIFTLFPSPLIFLTARQHFTIIMSGLLWYNWLKHNCNFTVFHD